MKAEHLWSGLVLCLTVAVVPIVLIGGAYFMPLIVMGSIFSGMFILTPALGFIILKRTYLSQTVNDFQSRDLSGQDLRAVDLSYLKLSGHSLQASDLKEANLEGCDLTRADLRYADLRGVKMKNAKLKGARLKGAIFDRKSRLPFTYEDAFHKGMVMSA